ARPAPPHLPAAHHPGVIRAGAGARAVAVDRLLGLRPDLRGSPPDRRRPPPPIRSGRWTVDGGRWKQAARRAAAAHHPPPTHRLLFTGLAEALAPVERVEVEGDGRALVVAAPFAAELAPGESVAVNGACLTVVAHDDRICRFQAGPETLRRTNLG